MRFSYIRPIIASLVIAILPVVAGCGGDAEGTSAAINGPNADGTQSDADSIASAGQAQRDPLHPVVLIDTSLGAIQVRLDAEKSPLTVDNFLTYVDTGHYNNTIFHQVIQDSPKVVLGGAFTPELTEKEGRTPIVNEARNGLRNTRGTIAMARQPDAVDSATCHFYLNLDNNDVLDHRDETLDGYGYCVFGTVTQGLDVLDQIGAAELHDTNEFARIPVQTVMIKSVRRIR